MKSNLKFFANPFCFSIIFMMSLVSYMSIEKGNVIILTHPKIEERYLISYDHNYQEKSLVIMSPNYYTDSVICRML